MKTLFFFSAALMLGAIYAPFTRPVSIAMVIVSLFCFALALAIPRITQAVDYILDGIAR